MEVVSLGEFRCESLNVCDGRNKLKPLPLLVVVMLIPGAIDDLLVNIVVLIDALMIFGAERRCLHDYIAGSKVVLYRENRQKLA